MLNGLLYETFREVTGSAETFDDFYFWGEILLDDFDDIDKYMVNAEDLFSNLLQLKDIGNHFDYLTEEQVKLLQKFWGTLWDWDKYRFKKEFVSTWEKLAEIYGKFRKKLDDHGIGYEGMIIRQAAETLLSEKKNLPFEKYLFAGLNALNSCEKLVLNFLNDQNQAIYFWDYDVYYVNNPRQNAGRFLRENIMEFPPPPDFYPDTDNFSGPKNLELVAVASGVGQAQVIPGFLNRPEIKQRVSFDSTAIILADEALLFPVLGAVPDDHTSVNVTMGYPVLNSSVVSLMMMIGALVRNTRIEKNRQPVLYFRMVEGILQHQMLAGIETDTVTQKLKDMRSGNRIYLSPEELFLSSLHTKIFTLPHDISEYSNYFLEILKELYQTAGEGDSSGIVREMIYGLYSAVEKLKTAVAEVSGIRGIVLSPPVYFRLMHHYLSQLTVPFEGEPLSGLQVMGILETRCLDFENLVIIGLNEDSWPRTSSMPSMIPYNLRKGFGLPGSDDREAMYAYYFYRLLQKAKNVVATWNTVRETSSAGELSRFGYQLLLHSPHMVKQLNMDMRFYNHPVKPLTIPSNDVISGRLLEINRSESSLSPSAIISYMHCSLRFYFNYVAGLKEPDEITDDIDRVTFGNIFHKAMENLYLPYVGAGLEISDFKKIIRSTKAINTSILQAFATEYFRWPVSDWEKVVTEGKSSLIFSTIRMYVRNLLETDSGYAPVIIRALEYKAGTSLEVPIDGNLLKVRIGGRIDRVDETAGKLRIIDYKTGSPGAGVLQFKSVEELFDTSKRDLKKEALQSLIYSYILKKGGWDKYPVYPAIYSVISMKDSQFNPFLRMNNQELDVSVVEKELEYFLSRILGEIFSSGGSFIQTEILERCKYCLYKPVCRR